VGRESQTRSLNCQERFGGDPLSILWKIEKGENHRDRFGKADMKKKLVIAFIVVTFLPASISAIENMGPESIVLQGGSSGEVPFPHHRHQTALKDCNPCHSLYPQVSGSIEKMKAEGKLKKKQAMNLCKTCHKNLTAQGQKAGPVKCRDCHKK